MPKASVDAAQAKAASVDGEYYEPSDDLIIEGVYCDCDGFPHHTESRCREKRRRPDCGHSRDGNLADGRCGYCVATVNPYRQDP